LECYHYETDRHRQTQTDRQTDKQTQTDTDIQTYLTIRQLLYNLQSGLWNAIITRQTDTDRHRETQTDRLTSLLDSCCTICRAVFGMLSLRDDIALNSFGMCPSCGTWSNIDGCAVKNATMPDVTISNSSTWWQTFHQCYSRSHQVIYSIHFHPICMDMRWHVGVTVQHWTCDP